MNHARCLNNISKAIQTIKKGLEEMSEDKDNPCIYPDCDNCGECYFRETLKYLEEAIK